jgi:hypothetical protein
MLSTSRVPAARTLLSGIYGWFKEGHETRDLVQARTLLERLR